MLADVVAITLCWQMLCLGCVADVINTSCCCVCGRWKATIEDVIALCVKQVADVIATSDRWHNHS